MKFVSVLSEKSVFEKGL